MKRINLNAAVLMRAEGEDLTLIRNYENLSMNYYGEHSAADFTKLLKQGKKWKRVKIMRLPFKDEDEYRRMMIQLESWVESLKLYYLCFERKEELEENEEDELEADKKFNFRHLTDLDIVGCDSSFLSVFTSFALKLKKSRMVASTVDSKLNLFSSLDHQNGEVNKHVVEILAKCGELEELSLVNWKMSTVFSANAIKMMSFNLKKFDVTFHTLYKSDAIEERKAIKAFLKVRSKGETCLTVNGEETSIVRFMLD